MRKVIFLLLLFSASLTVVAQNSDSTYLGSQIQRLDLELKMVQQNQLNYSIEKEVLQENYKSTLDRINLTITIILGIFSILGFLGLKDLNSIKKNYTQELSDLKNLHEDIKRKFLDFDSTKKTYKEELDKILNENKDQTKKIQVLELKEKIRQKIVNKSNTEALEYCIVALALDPEDQTLLELKGRVHSRLGQFNDSVKTFEKLVALDPKNDSNISNLVETYYIANDIVKAKELIDQNKSKFEKQCEGKLMILFELIDTFHNKTKEDLIQLISKNIEKGNLDLKNKRIENWDLSEAIYATLFYKSEEKAIILRHFLWYWDGQISSKDLIIKIGLKETDYTS